MSPRTPVETRPPRMEPLARLPVFLALKDRRAVVAGGSPAAAWKAELLSAAGARVEVFAAEASAEMTTTADASDGAIAIVARGWRADDMHGAAIAIGDLESDAEAEDFAAAARAAGVPVNAIDRPAHCDFTFGAIVNRSPLVIGISTDGAAPVFGQAIRARLEGLLPRGFAQWAEAARRWRGRVQASGLKPQARKAFWRAFTARAITAPDRAPEPCDLETLLREAAAGAADAEAGSVLLVGAGPGDPELLTLRAMRAMQSADIILYDDLVSPEVLEFARREARKMLVGKTGHGPACKQQDINALMVSLAKSGRRVLRLKGGDPNVFGRAGEELDACRAAGVAVEVVPGITAAQGAAARLGISLTQRRDARRLQYVTGHGADGRLPGDIDWRALTDPAASTVVYMPVKTLASLASRAIAEGLDPQTPAVAVSRATRPDQREVYATIAELAGRLDKANLPGPVLVMFGKAFAPRDARATLHGLADQGVATGASSESTFRISS